MVVSQSKGAIMAMTLRLSDEAEANLAAIRSTTGLSKNAAIESAIHQLADRYSQVDRARAHVAKITERDAELLDRLADL
jgi:predicted transcriptional regulator